MQSVKIKELQIINFRSFVKGRILFNNSYTCLVGSNDVGKSNVLTAYKWLYSPFDFEDHGRLPEVDLPRRATSLTSSIVALVNVAEPIDFGFPTENDGIVAIERYFQFSGRRDENGSLVGISSYGISSDLLVLNAATHVWQKLPESIALLPRLCHIRPSDIGQIASHPLLEDQAFLQKELKWPSKLGGEDEEWVNQALARIFPQTDWHTPYKISIHPDKRIIAVWDRNGYVVPLRKAGNGIRQIIYSLVSIALAKHEYQKTQSIYSTPIVIAIDEPEQFLSSGLQKTYARFLQELSSDYQIIVTSHSAHFLDSFNLESAALLIRDEDNGTAQVIPEEASPEVIRQVLGISISDSLVLGKVTIVVEGESEMLILKQVFRDLWHGGNKSEINPDDITFVSRNGASNIPLFVTLVAQLGLPVLVLLDNDREGTKAEGDILKRRYGPLVTILKVPLEDGKDEAEIEDLLPENLLREAVIEYIAKHRDVLLMDSDFDLINQAPYPVELKKYSDRLTYVLKARSLLQSGVKLDDYISKVAVVAEVLEKLKSANETKIHEFLSEEVPRVITNMVKDFEALNTPGWSADPPVKVNTRGFQWPHQANLANHLDHDS